MDTIDITIDVPAPPREDEQEIERMFVEKATRAGAIHAHILKKNGDWTYVAEFVDPEKAALYAEGLAKATGAVIEVDIKPTRSVSEKSVFQRFTRCKLLILRSLNARFCIIRTGS